MKSAVRRLRNAAPNSQPPVPLANNGFRNGGHMFDLGTGRQSKLAQLRTYQTSGTVFAIVNLLSSSAAFPAWHLYKKQPADGRRRYAS